MTKWISRELVAAIRAEAAARPLHEICGLLLGRDGIVADARACANVAADPRDSFEIDPAALIAAHRRARAGGPAILGCYHSHPGGSPAPSPRDAVAAAANGWIWLIVGADAVAAWRAVEQGARFGRFDPLPLPS